MNYIKKARPNEKIKVWMYKLPTSKQKYNFSLQDLQEDYKYYKGLSDAKFKKNLLKIAHFACIVSYYKDLKPLYTIADDGIIHDIIHYLNFSESKDPEDIEVCKEALKNIRKIFNEKLEP
jgi:hypothetical protein